MKKIIATFALLVVFSTSVFAATTQQKLTDTNSQIKETQSELNSVKTEKKTTLNEINSLDKKINSTEDEIDSLEQKITNLEQSIVIAEENIKFMETEFLKEDNQLNQRLVARYKSGSVSFWDVLFSSKDVSDFISKYYMMQEVLEYDSNLLDKIKEDKAEIEKSKLALQDDKDECIVLKEEASEKRLALSDTKVQRTKYLSKLEASEDELEASIDELKKEADKLTAELKAASGSSTSKYCGGTMEWPLPNYYTITSGFGNRMHPVLKVYKLHTGIDIAGGGCNGKPVVAANSGTVIRAEYNKGYGNYIVIDHGGGITTLYGHSSKLLVKKGDYVKKGQEIMKVGTTGYSTGPHLHFEIRENGTYINPLDSSKGYLKK